MKLDEDYDYQLIRPISENGVRFVCYTWIHNFEYSTGHAHVQVIEMESGFQFPGIPFAGLPR